MDRDKVVEEIFKMHKFGIDACISTERLMYGYHGFRKREIFSRYLTIDTSGYYYHLSMQSIYTDACYRIRDYISRSLPNHSSTITSELRNNKCTIYAK